MAQIEVWHEGGSYLCHVAPGVLGRLPATVEELFPGRRVALVTDTTVARHYASYASDAASPWRHGADSVAVVKGVELAMPPGESQKTRERWSSLTDALLEAGYGRDSAIIALGGGVVGDVAGFVAATFMRGIPFIQVPTTLLSMLDASVGGKVAVDTPHGKNLVGAFHQPAAVLADPLTLSTLGERQFRSGLAEAVKHALIADEEYFVWLESNGGSLLARRPEALTDSVERSLTIKAEVVSADEKETGLRMILNAGHTIGHALEHVSGYRLLHGEAVALGLLAETALAEQLGIAEPGLTGRLGALLTELELPTTLPDAQPRGEVLAAMDFDKKAREGSVKASLPRRLGSLAGGQAYVVELTDAAALDEALLTIGVF